MFAVSERTWLWVVIVMSLTNFSFYSVQSPMAHRIKNEWNVDESMLTPLEAQMWEVRCKRDSVGNRGRHTFEEVTPYLGWPWRLVKLWTLEGEWKAACRSNKVFRSTVPRKGSLGVGRTVDLTSNGLPSKERNLPEAGWDSTGFYMWILERWDT